jgi:hypothetical protein
MPHSSAHSAASQLHAPDARRLGRWFTAVRRQGFLAHLSPETWQTLSAILSFTCRDGQRLFTVDQLGVALGRSPEEALARLEELVRAEWQGEPLATPVRDPHGEIVGAVLAPIEALSGETAPLPADGEPGWQPIPAISENPHDVQLAADLTAAGLRPEQIERLLRTFPHDRVRRQLAWLPARQARNPAALLIRAVEQDWGTPGEEAA